MTGTLWVLGWFRKVELSTCQVFRTKDGRFSVVIEDGLLEYMCGLCAESTPLETGGILIGSYTEGGNTASVTRVEGPPYDSKRERNRFYRGTDGLQDLIEALWKSGEYYLGEWHCHPGGLPEPSRSDLKQMKAISEDREAHCPEPLLVVISEAKRVAVRVFPKGEPEVEMLPDCAKPRRGDQSDDTDR